jgi:DNA (cytosine-5)-methyltransferase 1
MVRSVSLKVVDLFSGCGGISCGFRMEGFEIVAGVDLNRTALGTYQANFPGALTLERDLSILDPRDLLESLRLKPGDLDCLVGGPPCQGFSKNVPASSRYLEDPRNRLVSRFLDFVRVLKPKVVLIENVAEMKNAYDESYTKEIEEALNLEMGYETMSMRFDAVRFSLPTDSASPLGHRRRHTLRQSWPERFSTRRPYPDTSPCGTRLAISLLSSPAAVPTRVRTKPRPRASSNKS